MFNKIEQAPEGLCSPDGLLPEYNSGVMEERTSPAGCARIISGRKGQNVLIFLVMRGGVIIGKNILGGFALVREAGKFHPIGNGHVVVTENHIQAQVQIRGGLRINIVAVIIPTVRIQLVFIIDRTHVTKKRIHLVV